MEFDRDKVNTDDEMFKHLVHSDCSVCVKIAFRLNELAKLLKEKNDAEKASEVPVPSYRSSSVQ